LNIQSLKSSDIEWADMIFATAMLVQKDSLKQVVKRCKAKGKRVVLGGPYVTTTIEDLPDADHIFLGEAETTVPQFVADLARGEPKRSYQAAERPPLSATPMAHFHLADLKRSGAMSVQYSRGCPFLGSFFDNMRDAGFRRVFLGIETAVEESLKEAQKSQNRGNLLDSVKKIQSYGMEVMAGFIVGFDNDPADIFQRQIDFIRQSAIPLAMVGLLNALPETQLWKRLEREGRLLGEASGNNTTCTFNFKTRMDPALLIQGYQTIMRTIYSPREYYERALDSMRRTAQESSEPQH